MKKHALLAAAAVVGAGVAFQGSVNLQATTPGTPQTGHLNITGTAKAGVMVGYSSTPTGIAFGGDFRSASTGGRGVLGNASATTGATYGGLFQSFSNAGRGVAGIAQNATGNTYGGFFSSLSVAGYGVYGQATAASGTTYGVYGKALSPAGYGVFSEGRLGVSAAIQVGVSGAPTSANRPIEVFHNDVSTRGSISAQNAITDPIIYYVGRVAIQGISLGPDYNIGVGGHARSTDSPTFGVLGGATGATTNYGVFGEASLGLTNWAGYFNGGLYADSANSGVKAFMIDHPMDPANKVLMHSSVESDERKNIYDGVVTTDSRGLATITMPNWFEALNEDFRYQVTVIDDTNSEEFILTKVVQRLRNGKFKIRTSVPGATVSWQITGNRHDPTSNYLPLQVERLKNKDEKGKYYVPEAYGKDESLGMGYVPRQTAAAAKPKVK
jgi:hypothetical protein